MVATADARIQRTHKAVVDECELLLASDAFDAWKGAETLQVGDLIACNNSFLYREGQSTTKSSFYLGIEVSAGPNFTLPPVVVTANSRINSQFKRLAARELSKYEIGDLTLPSANSFPDLARLSSAWPAGSERRKRPKHHLQRCPVSTC